MTRIHFLLTQLVCSALALLLPAGAAWANWGENWGSMVWSAPPPVVPGLGALGLALLALGLAAAAAWQLRRRAFAMSVLLVVLAIPLAAVAGSVSGLNVFVNGQPADAGAVNENFEIIEDAVNDNDTRFTVALSVANTALTTANDAATDASAAQVRVAGTCAAGSSIRAIAAKWTFEDLIPGLSDFDTRFILEGPMAAEDWNTMSLAVGAIHTDLAREFPKWARNLEHLPGVNFTVEEILDSRLFFPESQQWTFYEGDKVVLKEVQTLGTN